MRLRMISTRRLGFTLIEVLIGIMVLALGLLGLGAVIPVVVRSQRHAMEAQLGLEAAKAARAYLTSRPDLDPTTPFQFTTGTNPQPVATIGWDIWLLNRQNWSPAAIVGQTPPVNCYLWEPWKTGTSPGSNTEMDVTTGNFGWDDPPMTPNSNVYADITLADRLWPSESVQGADILRPGYDPHRPLFVWDFVGRRVQTRPGEPEQLQIAVFVRRLDLNIRIPRGNWGSPAQPITLRDVVLNRHLAQASDHCVPVCSYSPTSGAQSYLPTNTGTIPGGTPNYSEPIFLDADFDPDDPARIEFPNITRADNQWKLVSVAGQKLVDNLGNVYTVRGIADDLEPGNLGASTEVLVDPPVPSFVPDPANAPSGGPGTLRQVVFMPQTPAAVDIFTITRTVP